MVLAKAIANADVLSKGRVIFGAAIGWMEGEFQALNAPFADRGAVSDEYLQLLRELWTNPTPTFQGEHFQIADVTFSPMPVQKPHPPIWVGGRSRREVRRAVRYGDAWYPSQLPPAQVAVRVEHMREFFQSGLVVGQVELLRRLRDQRQGPPHWDDRRHHRRCAAICRYCGEPHQNGSGG